MNTYETLMDIVNRHHDNPESVLVMTSCTAAILAGEVGLKSYDAVVGCPPFAQQWNPVDTLIEDVRFKDYGLPPKGCADFAFLLHGFYHLKEDGVMVIVLPQSALRRGGADGRIRTKLLKNGHIHEIILLGRDKLPDIDIPVCAIIMKKTKSTHRVFLPIKYSLGINDTKGQYAAWSVRP